MASMVWVPWVPDDAGTFAVQVKVPSDAATAVHSGNDVGGDRPVSNSDGDGLAAGEARSGQCQGGSGRSLHGRRVDGIGCGDPPDRRVIVTVVVGEPQSPVGTSRDCDRILDAGAMNLVTWPEGGDPTDGVVAGVGEPQGPVRACRDTTGSMMLRKVTMSTGHLQWSTA